MLQLYPLVLLHLLLIYTNATSFNRCGEYNVSLSVVTCNGVVEDNLTIPCGPIDVVQEPLTYIITTSLQPSFTSISTDTYLQLKLNQSLHNAIIQCLYGNTLQASYSINICYPPSFDVSLLNEVKEPVAGLPFVAHCPVTSNPPSSYTWQRYNDIDQTTSIPLPSQLQYTDLTNRTWSIDSWHQSMNGFYTCSASNPLGLYQYIDKIALRLFNEDCQGIGSITSYREPAGQVMTYPTSQEVVLQCLYGNTILDQPPSWYYQPFNSSHDPSIIKFTPSTYYNIHYHFNDCQWNSTLIIFDFSTELSGNYWCEYNDVVQYFNIDVEECYKMTLNRTSLKISPSSPSVTADRGSTLIITCLAHNIHPSSAITWYKDSHPINVSTSIYNDANCTLTSTIELVMIDESIGTYWCTIDDTLKDSISISIRGSVSLEVVVPLVVMVIGVAVAMVITSTLSKWHKVTSYTNAKEPPYGNYKWDVFISYHSEVETFADEGVRQVLEREGYSICWHHKDFVVGRPIVDNINEAVYNSRKVVIILTDKFVTSKHCMMELHLTLHRLRFTRTRCMVPIMLGSDDGCIPRELKSSITYWPLVTTGNDYRQKLLNMIGIPLQKHKNIET